MQEGLEGKRLAKNKCNTERKDVKRQKYQVLQRKAKLEVAQATQEACTGWSDRETAVGRMCSRLG